ncbi:MAG: sulfatase [Opitutales bacterium]|nr:sulfatase [Opitutales bacterium]
MNVLLIHSHDCGRYFSPYGHAVQTPHIQAFADRSTLFRNAFSAAPTCSPSRAALLSGQWAHEVGMLGLAHRGFKLKHPERHLAHFLREHGYHTALVGIQHEFGGGEELPYSEVRPVRRVRSSEPVGDVCLKRDERVAKAAAGFLAEKRDQPFFLSCGFFLGHRPFPSDGPARADQILVPPGLPDTEAVRADLAGFHNALAALDEQVGTVLTALAQGPHKDSTLVIFTIDHGIPFPRMKGKLHDSGIGVALIVDFPDNPARGRSFDQMVSHVDIFPTICDLADIPVPEWVAGLSLTPLMRGEMDLLHDAVFAETNFHAAREPARCVRMNHFKLIRCFDEDFGQVPANCDDSPSKDLIFRDAGLLNEERDEVELFDLRLDPFEGRNIARDNRFTDVRHDLERRLRGWMESTGDPLIQGPLELPRGARVQKRRCFSHEERSFE